MFINSIINIKNAPKKSGNLHGDLGSLTSSSLVDLPTLDRSSNLTVDCLYFLLLQIQINKGHPMTQASIQQPQVGDENPEAQNGLIAKSNKKVKVTAYLTEQVEQALTELYIARYRNDRKVDRSVIISEAILAMYEKEHP
jgi:hypothetical protein